MSPGEGKKLKTTRERKCPECGSEKVISSRGPQGSGAFGGKLPKPTRRLSECQDCGNRFFYVGPST